VKLSNDEVSFSILANLVSQTFRVCGCALWGSDRPYLVISRARSNESNHEFMRVA
jgi:hypothetical protein